MHETSFQGEEWTFSECPEKAGWYRKFKVHEMCRVIGKLETGDSRKCPNAPILYPQKALANAQTSYIDLLLVCKAFLHTYIMHSMCW